jgi:type IV pilus assembly protein PilV
MDKRRSSGFTMLEVLISLFIMSLGLLGLAALQVRAQQAELESYQRAQALVLLQDMVDRINSNRKTAGCYAFTPLPDNGTVFVGTGATAPTCAGAYGTTQTRARADADVAAWDALLKGSAEALGLNQVGAMVGARGCVSLDTSVTPNIYRVSVAWQGMTKTVNPTSIDATLTCGTGQYGSDLQRRVVSYSFPMACLNC